MPGLFLNDARDAVSGPAACSCCMAEEDEGVSPTLAATADREGHNCPEISLRLERQAAALFWWSLTCRDLASNHNINQIASFVIQVLARQELYK